MFSKGFCFEAIQEMISLGCCSGLPTQIFSQIGGAGYWSLPIRHACNGSWLAQLRGSLRSEYFKPTDLSSISCSHSLQYVTSKWPQKHSLILSWNWNLNSLWLLSSLQRFSSLVHTSQGSKVDVRLTPLVEDWGSGLLFDLPESDSLCPRDRWDQ